MQSKLLATLTGLAIAIATSQFAAAGERQHIRKPARPSSTEQFRNANAALSVPQGQSGVYPYSGGWSAPAGH